MITQIQTANTLDLSSKPVNSRAPEFYREGSSFHDLFTAATDVPAVKAAPAASVPAASVPATSVPAAAAPLASAPAVAAVTNPSPSIPATPSAAADAPPVSSPTFEQGAVVNSPDGSTTPLNSMEMASVNTAAQIAAKLGGTVTADVFSGGFSTSADIREISFTGSNVKINAGIAATLFSMYGDAPGSQAWRTINNDLGRDPMATGPVS
jgi:hypothetical protein